MNTEIKQLDQSLANLRNTMQTNDAKIKKLDELKTEVSTLQDRLVVLTEQLPPGSEVSGLLLQIQKLVNQSGLVLKLWKPDKQRPHPSGLYEEIPISLVLTGGYDNTASLFDHISKLTRIVNILNIKMGGAKVGKSGNIEVDINCTAMTFAAVEKKVEPTPKTGKKVL
ncbi:MAG TPA: type 4a pilus biogenesis protein PilO [Nitrospirota bacterium]|nr:type 4a pilus biogenesis protein PilO [Nitrospirota bacterium]